MASQRPPNGPQVLLPPGGGRVLEAALDQGDECPNVLRGSRRGPARWQEVAGQTTRGQGAQPVGYDDLVTAIGSVLMRSPVRRG
jgi:hypothetical protein